MKEPPYRIAGEKQLLEDLEPWLVHHDGCGGSYLTNYPNSTCPETHVRCHDAYCVPSYTLNNGVYDCPYVETDDEYVPEDFSCPGYYRCFKSHVCVHDHYLCDGVHHCPLRDDERYCHLTQLCPEFCVCEGLAYTCTRMVNTTTHYQLRYLDVHSVNLSAHPMIPYLYKIWFIQFLNLSHCSLTKIDFAGVRNLVVLDLSDNDITNFLFINLTSIVRLKYLSLSRNPFVLTFFSPFREYLCSLGKHIQKLHIADTGIKYLPPDAFHCEDTKSSTITELDISFNKLEIEKETLVPLERIETITTSDNVICCIYHLTI